MEDLLSSGRVAEAILGLMASEGLALLALRRRLGRGPSPAAIAASLLAGGFLLLALRAALTGAAWPWLAIWLLAALLAHVADLLLRWRA